MRDLIACVTAAIVTFFLSQTSVGNAAYRRFSGNNCTFDNINTEDYQVGENYIRNLHSSGTGFDTRRVIRCPLPNDSDFPTSAINGVAVDGLNSGYTYSDSTSMLMWVCRQSNLSGSGICSTYTGHTSLAYMSVWLNSNAISILQDSSKQDWYSSVSVALPRENWGYYSYVSGYAVFNPLPD